jgi:hypothetical protein
LKKGGRLLLTTPNMTCLDYITRRRKGGIAEAHPIGHIHAWNLIMIKDLIESVGFKILEAKLINHYGKKCFYKWFICEIYPNLRGIIFIAAMK